MNNLTSRQVCAAAKVSGCILGLLLVVVGMIMTPYFCVIIGFTIIIFLLYFFKNNLPKSLLEISLVAAAGWIIPSFCGVMYWLTPARITLDGSPAPTFVLNIVSILLTALFVALLILAGGFALNAFNYFLNGCTDHKDPDNGVAPDSNIKETDASVLAR